MAINESIYGAKNTWVDSVFNPYITNKNKVANFGNNSSRLQSGVSNNKLSYETPIDKSLSYCGLGTESALSHIGYIYKQSGTYAVREWQDSFVTNFAFFQQNSTAVNMSPYPEGCYFESNRIYQTLAWQSDRNNDNKNQYLQPYVLINPQNQVLCIYIRACNNSITDFKDVPMSTYISTYKTSYPKIISVYLRPYFNNQAWTAANPVRTLSGDTENSLNANQLSFSYGRLDNYKCEGKNFDVYSYYLNNCTIMGSSSFSDVTKYDDKMLFVMATENCKSHVNIYTTGGDNDYLNAYIEYFDGIEEEIYKTVACFGLYFTPNKTVAKTGKFTNNDMYIGLLDENGIGHGLYLRGADTANAPQNNYVDMNESGYDYTKKVDKTDYQNNTTFYGNLSSRAFTKMYVLTDAEVSSLANELYTAVSQAPAGEEIERYNQSVFLTQNPIDCIISLKKFPCELPFSTSTAIKLGSYTCTTTGSPLLYTTGVYQFTFSNALKNSLYPVNDKSFLDYEPYTKAELSIPFCGTVEIPCSYLYDYDDLTAYLIIDYITGACTAYITARGIAIDSTSGNAAITMPVNGLQSATLDSQIHAAAVKDTQASNGFAISLAGGAAAIIASLFTGGAAAPLLAVAGAAVGIGGAALNAQTTHESIDYELQHMQTPLKQISAASGAISQSYDMRCKLRITRPKLDNSRYDAAVYANTVGYACCINTTVNKLTGLTVGTVNLDGIAATETEKQMIAQAFAQGVIL